MFDLKHSRTTVRVCDETVIEPSFS